MEHALCPVLVGRDAELSELEDALLGARRGEGRVVVLAGDAGMGKTRLATELQQRARRLGMSVLWGGCSEAELALPYLPFLEAIGNYLAGADVEEVRSRLGPVRRELAHLFPQLEPAGVAPDVDSTQGRMRLYEAVLALLDLAASEGGLLLLIEDLHWADASTRELLDYLTRRLRNARIMVLATHRSDEVHRRHPLLPLIQGWRRSSSAKIVDLAPLTPDKVAQMVIAIFDLGSEGVADDTRDFLHGRTEGNPFVLEEMLKAALDRGDIYRGDAGWTRKALDDFRLPNSVRDTILLRLDRLSQQQVDILRAAATLGNNFSYEVLVTVSGRPAAEVREAVEACVLQQLLADDPRRAQADYRFRHALTREAIYDDIITPTRQELHGRAADALLSSGGTPVEVSLHLLAAGRTVEAIPFCLEAAVRAELEYAHADAAALYERVLPFLVDPEQRATILCQLGAALHGAGRSTSAYDYLKSGIALMDQIGQVPQTAHFRVLLGRCAWEVGKPADAVAALERARAELEPAGPSADLAITYARLASMRLFEQDGAGCVKLAEAAMSIAEAAGAMGVFLQAQMYRGAGLIYLGRVEEGIELEERSFLEAVEAGLYSVAIVAFNNLCTSRVVHHRAAEVIERLPLFDRVPDSNRKSIVLGMSEGQAAYVLGDLPRAIAAFQVVNRVARQDQAPVWIRRSQAWLADCYFAAGQPDRAREILPAPDQMAEISIHDLLNFDVLMMRSQLALGAPDAAIGAAALILDGPQLSSILRTYLASWSSWTYIATDQPDLAARAVSAGIDQQTGLPAPYGDFLKGAQSCLDGDLESAVNHLREGLAFLDSVGYHSDACFMRRRLSELLTKQGDEESARAELQVVLAAASRLGMVVERQLAKTALERLGFAIAPTQAASETSVGAPGERYVTVLFVDVRGFAAMSLAQSPAQLADAVATLQRWAGATVEVHHGIVDKFAGDAVMATFNVSGAHVDHARHALTCAIAIRDKASAIGLPVGGGIATGPAVVGALREGGNISVVGETTNLASRLQSQAAAGEILLSPETHRRVRDWLTGESYPATLERLKLKGFADPVEAWRLAAR